MSKKTTAQKLIAASKTISISAPGVAKSIKSTFDEIVRMHKVMEFLEIPTDGGSVDVYILYDIFMNEKKCQELISKLRNKAFW